MSVKGRIERLERGQRAERWMRQLWHKCDALDEAFCEATAEVVAGQELDEIRRTVGELYDIESLHLWPYGDGTDCLPDRVAYWRRRMAQRKEHLEGRGSTPRHSGFDVVGCPDCDQAVCWKHGIWEIPPEDWQGWAVDREALTERLTRAIAWRRLGGKDGK